MYCVPASYFRILITEPSPTGDPHMKLRQIPYFLDATFFKSHNVATSNMGIHLLNLEFSKTEL